MKTQMRYVLTIILIVLVLLTISLSGFYGFTKTDENVTEISSVTLTIDGQTQIAKLPASLKDLSHGTEVMVSFTLPENAGDTLFFGSVYAPLTILVNGADVYEYGAIGTYPSFFNDPPTHYDSIDLSDKEPTDIQMRYTSPNERTTLSIHAPIAGNKNSILHYLLTRYGLSMICALFFIFLGFVLVLMSPFFLRMETQNYSFLMLGLLCLFAGAWQFGENTFSVYLLQSPSLLYTLDFLGLFLLVIPLYKMGLFYLKPKFDLLLRIFLFLMEASVVAAVILQLTGTISFHRTLYYFHVLLPLAIIVLTSSALYEYLRNHNRTAGLFFVSFLILAVAALLEVINYRIHFLSQYSAVFQSGLFVFIISMAVFSGISMRNLYTLHIKNLTLENEVKLQEQTITAQKKHNELLLSHFEEIRRQRHDMRHHLRTLNSMLHKGEYQNAESYTQAVADSVPTYPLEHYCDNIIINATLSYYIQQARDEGISVEIHTQIPENNPNISDANLCVIFGNLLENALEACRRIKNGSRRISLNAQVRGEVLFITMDNSYDGNIRTENGRFYSSKRIGFGTGLRSVQTLAETHQGAATFRGLENVFRSEVFLRL